MANLNWQRVAQLHGVSKLRELMFRWYGLDIVFFAYTQTTLNNGHSSLVLEKTEKSFSLPLVYSVKGRHLLSLDLEAILKKAQESQERIIFSSSLIGVKGLCLPLYYEKTLAGGLLVYPYEVDPSEHHFKQFKKTIEGLELGAEEEKELLSWFTQKRFQNQNGNVEITQKIFDLLDLIKQEIISYHQEIEKKEERISSLQEELEDRYRFHTIIGKSRPMKQLYSLIEKVASSEANIFISGENGTGKEMVAKTLHFLSSRKNKPFLAVNCSALNENLLESELFGHVKGAFTGAIKDKKGLFEAAHGGTLFLDEIGDTSLSMQVKLLRVLQEGTFIPVGDTVSRKVDVRIISATNKNLSNLIASGEFREDFFYRIHVIHLNVPPLRERKEDIPLLLEYFLEKRRNSFYEISPKIATLKKQITKACLEKLLEYSWPGNVRELENEVERLLILSGESEFLIPEFLSSKILEENTEKVVLSLEKKNTSIPVSEEAVIAEKLSPELLKDALEKVEIKLIKEGLERTHFNKTLLAKQLGISRANLLSKITRYALASSPPSSIDLKEFKNLKKNAA